MSFLAVLLVLAIVYKTRSGKANTSLDVFSSLKPTKTLQYDGTNIYVDAKGYKRFKDSDRLVHRYIAEKKLGRALESWEVVHHIDGNKLNNSWKNLEVYSSWKEHNEVHQNNLLIYGSWHKPVN